YSNPDVLSGKNNVGSILLDNQLIKDISANYVASPGLELSIRQRAVEFIYKFVPSFSADPNLKLPTNSIEGAEWNEKAKKLIDQLVYKPELRGFYYPINNDEVNQITAVFRSASPIIGPPDGLKKVQKLIEIRFDSAKSDGMKDAALASTAVLEEFVV